MWIPKGKYFIRREQKRQCAFEADYWGNPIDPDGKARDLKNEKIRKLKDLKNELNYVNSLSPGKIIDIGCGLGHFLSGVNDKWEKFGQDISKYALNEAKNYCKIFCGELHRAKFENNFFDVAFSYDVIEHAKHPYELVEEIYRILKKDGKFIIGTANFDSGCARRFGKNYRMYHDDTHISLFSDYSLREMLEDIGFYVEYIDYPFFETDLFTKENLNRLFDTSDVSPPFYGNIFTIYAHKI
jgi:SAM-dependent methyltransferase